jgi:hypothetical protein
MHAYSTFIMRRCAHTKLVMHDYRNAENRIRNLAKEVLLRRRPSSRTVDMDVLILAHTRILCHFSSSVHCLGLKESTVRNNKHHGVSTASSRLLQNGGRYL